MDSILFTGNGSKFRLPKLTRSSEDKVAVQGSRVDQVKAGFVPFRGEPQPFVGLGHNHPSPLATLDDLETGPFGLESGKRQP